MKRFQKYIGWFIGILFLNELKSNPPDVKINIISSDFYQFIFEIEIENYHIKDTFVENKFYQQIKIFPEEGHTGEIGKPELPVVTRLIAIPPKSGVFADFEIFEQETIRNIVVFPSQIGIFGDSIYPFQIDEIFYNQDIFYPHERINLGPPGILKNFRVIKISIFPFSYNPLKKKLIVYKKLRIKVYFSGIDTRNTIPSIPNEINEDDVPYYKSLILNYETFNPLEKVTFPGYLIITADLYYNALSPFVSWKRKIGYNVIVTKISEITNPQNPDTGDIRNYIKQQFNNLPDLSYVLLVGDGNPVNPQVPLYFASLSGITPDVYTDYYYSLVSGNDEYPDVCIGRFNVSNINELNVMINKCFKYERDVISGWNAHKVFLVAGIEGKPQMDSMYMKVKQEIKNSYLNPHNIPTVTAYGVDTTFNIVQKIKSEINNGVGLVNYRGHGGIDKWAILQYHGNPYKEFTNQHVRTLSNSDKLPIILNVACLTGSIHQQQEAMIEAWVLHSNGGGVAAMGATYETDHYVNNTFDKRIFEVIYDLNDKIIGHAINVGKMCIISQYPQPGVRNGLFHACAYVYNGDPSLHVWTQYPKEFTVNYPDSVYPNTTFSVNVKYEGNPIKDAKVCFYKDDLFEIIKLTDIYGKVNFDVTFSMPPGKAYILVSKFNENFKPYKGEIFIKLLAPKNLTATVSPQYDKVILNWEYSASYPHETGFEIWRKDININWRKVATLPANSTSYIDYNVSRFNDYFYKVRAFKVNGSDTIFSEFSNTCWVTTSPCIVSNVDVSSISPSTSNAIVYYNNSYHFVYSKNNKVYYTYSNDEGLTWSSPTFIDDGINPAIEVMGNTLWVFYHYPVWPSYYKFKYAKKIGNNWEKYSISQNIWGNIANSVTNFMDTIFVFVEGTDGTTNWIKFVKVKKDGSYSFMLNLTGAEWGSIGKIDTIITWNGYSFPYQDVYGIYRYNSATYYYTKTGGQCKNLRCPL